MKRQYYPSDVTDAQWRRIDALVPKAKPGGRPAKSEHRESVNGIFYLAMTGCTWRSLPHDLPPYRMVFRYFRAWQQDGTWVKIHDALRTDVRRSVGKRPKPSMAILDNQTVKTTEQGGPKGYGGEKSSAANGSSPLIRWDCSGP